MIRIKDIQNSLMHLVGWEQAYNTLDLRLSENLTTSESGLYFQQVHPLLTLENLASVAPDFKNAQYPLYDINVTYKKGNIVSNESGVLYKAKIESTGENLADEEYWLETNPFSEWLEAKTQSGIIKAISRYVSDKVIKGSYKTIFENKTLFDGTGRLIDTIKNRNNLVGFEIVPIRAKGITTKINKVGLQFTEPGAYTIYIMHSSCEEPIYTLNFIKEKSNSMEWFKVDDIYLPYESEKIDAGGSWYICYYQSKLPGSSKAIRKNRDWSKGPCNECSRHEYESWMLWSKYIEIHPFAVNEEFINSSVFNSDLGSDFGNTNIYLWDVEKNMYSYDTNYGINLDITVSCDITDFIIAQRAIFADIISKQVAVDMLREFAFNANARTNRHSINASKVDILYELDGDSASLKKSGLSYQLEQAFKEVELMTEGIDRACLPCINHGIKYRTI